MWYIMQADQDARIIVGFKEDSNADEFRKLERQNFTFYLGQCKCKRRRCIFLETGTVHIGQGLLVAEIQQTSDITYRLYDFDRVDAQGNTRELHVDLALEAINYKRVDTNRVFERGK
jgi:mannose-6-phosphate isomerase